MMDYRQLGRSGLKVPALSFGTGTFGGQPPFFSAWGATDVAGARRLVDICMEAGCYDVRQRRRVLRRRGRGNLGSGHKAPAADRVLISTKTTFRKGEGVNDVGLVASLPHA